MLRVALLQYIEKMLVNSGTSTSSSCSAKDLWEAVKSNNLKCVYRLVVQSEADIINTIYIEDRETKNNDIVEQEPGTNSPTKGPDHNGTSVCHIVAESKDTESLLQGGSLLHLACREGNQVMVELLLQCRVNVNLGDFKGRTPLHQCISQGNNTLAKFLLRRYDACSCLVFLYSVLT